LGFDGLGVQVHQHNSGLGAAWQAKFYKIVCRGVYGV
jgi:hypothetical protein